MVNKIRNVKQISGGMVSLSRCLDQVTRPVFAKRGFAQSKVITNWDKIVGTSLSRYSNPRNISYSKGRQKDSTLFVEAYDGSVATQLQYIESMILERLATYFGYKSITRIKIIQRPMDNSVMNQQTSTKDGISASGPKLSDDSIAELIPETIEDPILKSKLVSLAHTIYGCQSNKEN